MRGPDKPRIFVYGRVILDLAYILILLQPCVDHYCAIPVTMFDARRILLPYRPDKRLKELRRGK
jgi:hypothetical protein